MTFVYGLLYWRSLSLTVSRTCLPQTLVITFQDWKYMSKKQIKHLTRAGHLQLSQKLLPYSPLVTMFYCILKSKLRDDSAKISSLNPQPVIQRLSYFCLSIFFILVLNRHALHLVFQSYCLMSHPQKLHC